MLKLNITGTLAKFGWSGLPDEITDTILKITIDTAYMTAVKNAPVDPNDPPIHIKDELNKMYDEEKRIGYVLVKLPYANVAEYGSKKRLPHPYMRPAAKSAQNKMRSMIRSATKDAVNKKGGA